MNDLYIRFRFALLNRRREQVLAAAETCKRDARQADSDALALECKAAEIEKDMRALCVGLIPS